ncbi:hypothetical protein [Peteryoungia desertarenae]|nr:hypothetical protein [Peteryoungia desertarenae]
MALVIVATPLHIAPAFALSDIQILQASPTAAEDDDNTGIPAENPDALAQPGPFEVIPSPDPLINRDDADVPGSNGSLAELPEVIYDLETLPEPVRRMRQLILDAAATGDFSKLRPLLNAGPNETRIQPSDADTDPVDALRALSGDDQGVEVLAILMDILSTGFVHTGVGTPDEAYVWPYFAEKPLTLLSPKETVELLRIVTAGDVAGMQEYGTYNFFRTGIAPDGQWKFIVAGD